MLLIDTDPQANTTRVFIHPDIEINLDKSLYNSIIKLSPLSTIVRETRFPNLHIVASHIRLSSADLELAQALDNRSERLKRAIGKLREKYDYIIIDNPPSLGLLTINAFTASDKLLIPVSTGFFAMTGLVQLQETIEMVKQNQLNPNLEITGILCTFAENTNVSKDVNTQLPSIANRTAPLKGEFRLASIRLLHLKLQPLQEIAVPYSYIFLNSDVWKLIPLDEVVNFGLRYFQIPGYFWHSINRISSERRIIHLIPSEGQSLSS